MPCVDDDDVYDNNKVFKFEIVHLYHTTIYINAKQERAYGLHSNVTIKVRISIGCKIIFHVSRPVSAFLLRSRVFRSSSLNRTLILSRSATSSDALIVFSSFELLDGSAFLNFIRIASSFHWFADSVVSRISEMSKLWKTSFRLNIAGLEYSGSSCPSRMCSNRNKKLFSFHGSSVIKLTFCGRDSERAEYWKYENYLNKETKWTERPRSFSTILMKERFETGPLCGSI